MSKTVYIAALLVSAIVAFDELRTNLELRRQLAAAEAKAVQAEQSRDQLLSGGRWIRSYDAKTGFSTYRFAHAPGARP